MGDSVHLLGEWGWWVERRECLVQVRKNAALKLG